MAQASLPRRVAGGRLTLGRLGCLGRWMAVLALAVALVAPSWLPAAARAAQPVQPGAPEATASAGGFAPFTDLSGHWARQEIEALWARGAAGGPTGPGETPVPFRPDDQITRGQFVTVLVRALGYGSEAGALTAVPPAFRDLTPGSDLAGCVNVAAEYGLVRGYPDRTFRSDQPITRGEISALLVRVIGLDPSTRPPSEETLPFSDASAVPAWAAGYVALAYERGMIRGYPDQTFRPAEGATRAEAACLVGRTIRTGGQLFDVTGFVRGTSATGDTLAVDLWPAPSPEVVASSDGTWSVRRPEDLGAAGPGPTVYLQVPPTAIVYRNGAPSRRQAIQPLDEVSFVLDRSGAVVYAEATLVDGLGRLAAVAPDLASVSLEPVEPSGPADPAAARSLPVLDWAPVFDGGREVPREAAAGLLTPGTRVYFILDSTTGSIRALATLGEDAAAAAARETGRGPGDAGPAVAEDPEAESASTLGPAQAMALNRAVVGADALSASVGADGRGVVIAVIDTGVDVTHPDLAMTSALERKIIDWCDFSGEGDVETTRLSTTDGGLLPTDLGPARVTGLTSRSGIYHSGVLSEDQLDQGSPIGQDLDRNGSSGDSFLVVAVDRKTAGEYDTVYVDTDRDLDLTDESPLRPYRDTGLVGWFGDRDRNRSPRCSFVVADVRRDGNRVTLGFDGNGHGTHVAATASAYASFRGGPNGLAPGAKIMALKALGSSGDGTWANIVRAATYAAQHGANIITLSVANLSRPGGAVAETAELASLGKRYGVLIVVAAGNEGPGLGTTRGPGGSGTLITVGASLSEAMWKAYYGYRVPGQTIWPFSSVGPGANGAGGPDVVAPGCAVSAVPLWLETPGHAQYEGTSMAVPHVAGVTALLWQAARDAGLPVTAELVRAAVLAGASPVPGYSFVEQGFGAVNATLAWEWLARQAARGGYGAEQPEVSGGYFFRGGSPARIMVDVKDSSPEAGWFDLASDSDWLVPAKARLALPAGVTRTVPVSVAAGQSSGLYSGRLTGRGGRGQSFTVPVTVVVPEDLARAPGWRLAAQGSLGPARLARHFFEVPPGAAAIELTCGVVTGDGRTGDDRGSGSPGGTEGYRGRVRVFLYAPDGRLAASSGYVGEGALDASSYVDLRVPEPAGGVWEAVVYSSAALSAFGLEESSYWLEVGLEGLVFEVAGHGWEASLPVLDESSAAAAREAAGLVTRVWRPLDPVPVSGQPPTAPARVTGSLALTNAGPPFEAEVKGYGLWASAWDCGPDVAVLEPGTTLTRPLPHLDGTPGLLRVLLRDTGGDHTVNTGQAGPGERGPDLDLYLYRYEGSTWKRCAVSATPGVSSEAIELADPPAGDYVAFVEADLDGLGPTACELACEWLPAGGQVSVSTPVRSFGPNERATLPVVLSLPKPGGAGEGALRVSDRSGRLGLPGGAGATLSLLPLTVRSVDAATRVTVGPGGLRPGPNLVTFQIRDRDGARLEEFSLEVGGFLYEGRDGRVTVAVDVDGPAASLKLPVRLILPDGAAASWAFDLPVLAGEPEEDLTAWLAGGGLQPSGLQEARQQVARAVWGG